MNFIYSLQSEWLKTKRSAASWLCLIGGFFIPLIYLVVFIVYHKTINDYYPDYNVWRRHFNDLWQNMAGFLLPMGVILSSSLITQLEYKNNTWKQVHTSPQSFTTIFLAKFSVIVLMTLKFFLFFTIGILVSGIIPCLIFEHRFPIGGFPYDGFLIGSSRIFITCLPIIAIQYLISLKFKNFLVSIGIGLLGLIVSLIGLSWKYIYLSPYSYTAMNIFSVKREFNIYFYSFIYFVLLMMFAYYLYVSKKEKG